MTMVDSGLKGINFHLGGLERFFSWNCFNNYNIFFPPTSSHLHPLQVENCDSNSRLVVDEDDNGRFRFEMIKLG